MVKIRTVVEMDIQTETAAQETDLSMEGIIISRKAFMEEIPAHSEIVRRSNELKECT